MKDKSFGAIFQWQELMDLEKEVHVRLVGGNFSTVRGLFDGWIWEYTFIGIPEGIHIFYTDAYNVFNFDEL